MNSDKNNRKRRRRDPFDIFGFDDRFLNDMFDESRSGKPEKENN